MAEVTVGIKARLVENTFKKAVNSLYLPISSGLRLADYHSQNLTCLCLAWGSLSSAERQRRNAGMLALNMLSSEAVHPTQQGPFLGPK